MPLRSSLCFLQLALVLYGFLVSAQTTAPPEVPFPRNDIGLAALPGRQASQLAMVNLFKVPCQFHFTDQVLQSGIKFRNQAVTYATSRYMPVHYDHGTGI